ncbi:MAG: aminopeptidase [Candidatus Lokiarchaeota archaeon]|nr:aminopeptidase [Candidatus Lokiarchaeota archaeon]
MITPEKIKYCAESIANFINIQKEGETVLIKGGLYSNELLEEIALKIFMKGGIPEIICYSDTYYERLFQDESIKSSIFERTPMHYLKLIETMDAYIVIEPYEDPGVLNKATREKLKAKVKRESPIKDVIYGANKQFAPGKKWCYAGWPSQKAADYYNIPYSLLEQFIIGGMSVPQKKMEEITNNLSKNFLKASKVYISDDYGTDFWISIKDRPVILDNGIITEERISNGLLGGNLPAGELYTPPYEKAGEGTLYCPLTRDRLSNKIIKNITLPFKEGKLLIDKVSADENLEDLVKTFKQSEEIDKKNNLKELRTYNVGELGIGCNPEITKAIGYILTDEKINGSVHLAFGSNKMMGGSSVSQIHWDFVTAPEVNISVEYDNGSKKKIMEKGFLLDQA